MKFILITLSLFAHLSLLAQIRPTQSSPEGKREVKSLPLQKDAPYTFVELVIAEGTSGSTQLRLDFGREQLKNITDKELLHQIEESSAYYIGSVPDAMNYLKSLGYSYVTTYSTNFGGKVETRLVFERDLSRRKERPVAGQSSDSQPIRPGAARPTGIRSPEEIKK